MCLWQERLNISIELGGVVAVAARAVGAAAAAHSFPPPSTAGAGPEPPSIVAHQSLTLQILHNSHIFSISLILSLSLSI